MCVLSPPKLNSQIYNHFQWISKLWVQICNNKQGGVTEEIYISKINKNWSFLAFFWVKKSLFFLLNSIFEKEKYKVEWFCSQDCEHVWEYPRSLPHYNQLHRPDIDWGHFHWGQIYWQGLLLNEFFSAKALVADQPAKLSFHTFYQSQKGHCAAGIVSRAFILFIQKKGKETAGWRKTAYEKWNLQLTENCKNLYDMVGSYSFKKHPSSRRILSIMPFNLTSVISVLVLLKRHGVRKMLETTFFFFDFVFLVVIVCNDLSLLMLCAFYLPWRTPMSPHRLPLWYSCPFHTPQGTCSPRSPESVTTPGSSWSHYPRWPPWSGLWTWRKSKPMQIVLI